MTRPVYRDPWAPRDYSPPEPSPAPEPLSMGATVSTLNQRPVCDARESDGPRCHRLAVAVADVDPAARGLVRRLEPRCPDHAPDGAARVCVSCKAELTSGQRYHCAHCDSTSAWSDR